MSGRGIRFIKVESVVDSYGLGIRKYKSRSFVKFCQENNITTTNTWFKLPKRRLYTWRSFKNRDDQIITNHIDDIALNSRIRNSILSAIANPGCEINSHRNPAAVTKNIPKTKARS